MTAAEAKAVGDLAAAVVGTFLPEIIAAEVSKVPAPYGPIVQVIADAVLPQLEAKLQAYVASLEAAAAPAAPSAAPAATPAV